MTLPPPMLERFDRFWLVRDDLLEGGTKMRYMLPVIRNLAQQEIVYATPAVGYAQLALALVCRMLGKQAVLFVAKRSKPHPRTLAARAAGAIVYQVPHGYMTVVSARAKKYAADKGAYLIPFGVDIPEAIEHFAAAARGLEIQPAEVWACAGSGTLIRGLQQAWPAASFHAVQVGAIPDVGKARLWKAPEKFDHAAAIPPPYPSCENYDAKVWRFVREYAKDGALIWNVGR